MSHKPAKPIKEQILDLIERRKDRLRLEIHEFEVKKSGEESYWGLGGGNTRRYEKCIETREEEILELDAMRKNYGGATVQKTTRIRYRYRCASCGERFEVRWQIFADYIDCPYCRHDVSKETMERIEHEVIVPPMPNYYTDMKEWRQNFE